MIVLATTDVVSIFIAHIVQVGIWGGEGKNIVFIIQPSHFVWISTGKVKNTDR